MKLENLPRITKSKKKRVGRGHGSGRGKTAGRGTRGQKARNKIPLYFEGGALPLTKRLPFLRGKSRNKSFRRKLLVVNLEALNFLKKNTVVDLKTLVENRIVKEEDISYGVKILGDGTISVPLTIKLPISKSARRKIEKAGGKVE